MENCHQLNLFNPPNPPTQEQSQTKPPARRNYREENSYLACNSLRIEIAYIAGDEVKLRTILNRDDAKTQLGNAYYSSEKKLKNIESFLKSLMYSATCNLCPHEKTCKLRYDFKNREKLTRATYDKIYSVGLEPFRKELKKDLDRETCRSCQEIFDAIQSKQNQSR